LIGGREKGISISALTLAIAAIIVVASASAVYFSMFKAPIGQNNDHSNQISIEALSVSSSTSNLTATVNVKNSSLLSRVSLFINGTYVGSYNFTRNSWGAECFKVMRFWSNGTSSYYFTVTPYWMPMMGRWNWGDYGGMMGGNDHKNYVVTMEAYFANGDTSSTTAIIVPNRMGTGWVCRP
jgi:hypothetical protein